MKDSTVFLIAAILVIVVGLGMGIKKSLNKSKGISKIEYIKQYSRLNGELSQIIEEKKDILMLFKNSDIETFEKVLKDINKRVLDIDRRSYELDSLYNERSFW